MFRFVQHPQHSEIDDILNDNLIQNPTPIRSIHKNELTSRQFFSAQGHLENYDANSKSIDLDSVSNKSEYFNCKQPKQPAKKISQDNIILSQIDTKLNTILNRNDKIIHKKNINKPKDDFKNSALIQPNETKKNTFFIICIFTIILMILIDLCI